MRLLLLNSLKGLKKKKIQMLGIIVMVMLSTAIYTTMNSAIDRIEDRYYHYLEEHQVEHVSLEPKIDYQTDMTSETFARIRSDKLQDVTEEESQLLDLYALCLEEQTSLCTNQVYLGIEQVFRKYDAHIDMSKQKLDSLAKKYDFTYELQPTKMVTEHNNTTNVMPYDQHKKLNLPYLVDGSFPKKAGEITVLPKFAKANQLEIGDSYRINGKQYKIVGFAYASDYIYPMLSVNQPIFDEKYNNIVMMLPSDYAVFEGLKMIPLRFC
ncbi:MAG: hypothetical protein HFG15_04370 [Bacilli bacterium]|nr:hypothetical protein [Bacilli bacterium]